MAGFGSGTTPSTGVWGNTSQQGGSGGSGSNTTTATSPSLLDKLTNIPAGNRNAYSLLYSVLAQWDLTSLGPQVLKFIQQGWTADVITQVLLPETDEYKTRFSGNALRVKAGLAPLSPAEYIGTERAYRQVLQSSGLPATFYDSPEDYTKLIGFDISAQELQTRANEAIKYVHNTLGGANPEISKAWMDYYGVDTAHLAAHFLDPTAAQASLDRQANAVDIASAAARNGLNLPGVQRAEFWADQGVKGSDAITAYQKIGTVLPETENEAARFGQQYDQATAENEFLGGLASAQRARESLNRQEQSLWASSSPNNGPTLGNQNGGAY